MEAVLTQNERHIRTLAWKQRYRGLPSASGLGPDVTGIRCWFPDLGEQNRKTKQEIVYGPNSAASTGNGSLLHNVGPRQLVSKRLFVSVIRQPEKVDEKVERTNKPQA